MIHRAKRLGLILGAVLPLAACGAPSDAGAQPETQVDALPPAALAAWESYARGQCDLLDERFEPVAFAPVQGDGDVFERVEGVFQTAGGGFIAAELNGDDRPDFIIMTPDFGCVTSGPAYGQAGPPNDFLISTADGYRVESGFEGWISPSMIAREDGRDVLIYEGGGVNGRCGVIEGVVWGWSGQGMDVIGRRDGEGRPVDQDGCSVASAAAGAGTGGAFPPIPTGYYAVGTSCVRAIADGGEDAPTQLAVLDQSFFGFWDGGLDIRGFQDLGGGRWRVTARSFGNGDDATAAPADFTIRVTGPDSFVEETSGWTGQASNTVHTHCPTGQVPGPIRDWFES